MNGSAFAPSARMRTNSTCIGIERWHLARRPTLKPIGRSIARGGAAKASPCGRQLLSFGARRPRNKSPETSVKSSMLTAALALAILSGIAVAQDYPARPIRVIASSAPGGISDLFMRTLGEELTRRWGQPIVVENRVGGGMNIGGRARAPPPPGVPTTCRMPTHD